MPRKDTNVQAIRGTLETKHSEGLIDIVFIECSLLFWVCQIRVRTPVDVSIKGARNVSIGV
jgi:hypothetical protein